MKYTQFVEKMHQSIQACLNREQIVSVVEVPKNNGIVFTGISIRKENENVSPTIYLESFYREYCRGVSIEELTKSFLNIYEEKKQTEIPDVCFFHDYDKVKTRLAVKLVNKAKNQKLLQQMPYKDFLDLAIVFYCQIGETALGNATVAIRNEHIEKWKVDPDTLLRDALENTKRILPPQITKMEEIIQEFLGDEFHHDDLADRRMCEEGHVFPRLEGVPTFEITPMMVLTNSRKYLGAVGMIYDDVLENFGKELKDDFYILPSSIHEVILIPQSFIWDERELKNMVKEVNETQLDPEDILADSVYYYDRVRKTVIRCM